mgnify:CR=1 FL=1
MNEEIRQLADQCFIVDTQGNISANEYMIERFAELLIQECIHAVEDTNDRYRKEYFANQIRNRFGVK